MSDFKMPPRLAFAQAPTPIVKLKRFSEELGLELFIKREDLTGFEWSGNKIRKLEFLFKDLELKGANCVVTCGGVQSNHCRATAALAAKQGLRCILLLRGEAPKEKSSNFLLDTLFGAELQFLTDQQYYQEMPAIKANIESQVRQTGGRAYFIPEGGSNALGALGYLGVWDEIGTQLGQGEVPPQFDSILVAHGSGGTLAGLILGKICRAPSLPALAESKIFGVNVCYDKEKSHELVKNILWTAIQGYQMGLSFFSDDIQILDGFLGLGYAKNTPEELKFLARVARSEGVLLDPTYTAKAFRGLVETAKSKPGFFGKRLLFIHTGGGFGNFKAGLDWPSPLGEQN